MGHLSMVPGPDGPAQLPDAFTTGQGDSILAFLSRSGTVDLRRGAKLFYGALINKKPVFNGAKQKYYV